MFYINVCVCLSSMHIHCIYSKYIIWMHCIVQTFTIINCSGFRVDNYLCLRLIGFYWFLPLSVAINYYFPLKIKQYLRKTWYFILGYYTLCIYSVYCLFLVYYTCICFHILHFHLAPESSQFFLAILIIIFIFI